MTASAARLTRADMSRVMGRGGGADWQDIAWGHYDSVGELRYAVGWISNALSRATLFVAEGDTDVPEPIRVDEGEAVDYLNALFNGPAGQSQMLKSFGLQLSVPGECYVMGYRIPDDNDTHWCVASKDEIARQNEEIWLDRGDGAKIPITDEDWILRVWNSHPRKWWLADSPTRALLPVLRELDELTKKVFASVDSRLAGAGILALPQEMTFPKSSQEDDSEEEFNAVLHRAMTTPLQDRDSASAIVPIVIQVPGDQIGNIQHITFGHDLDSEITPLREAAIRRLALGLDMPPEILTGLGGMSHWNSWQVDEAAVKLHIEPMLATICDALTTGYLWPLLGGESDRTIWFDTSELTERPDRGPDADALFDRGELSGEALRRHHGFNDDEKPSDQERRERILIEIAKTNTELAPSILTMLGVASPGTLKVTNQADAEPRALPATPPSSPEVQGPPEQASMSISALLACDLAVTRALEVAGKKIRSTKLPRSQQGSFQQVPAWLMHTHVPARVEELDKLLDGAWSAFAVATPEFAALAPALDEYVRLLLQHGVAHERRCLTEVIRKAVTDGIAS